MSNENTEMPFECVFMLLNHPIAYFILFVLWLLFGRIALCFFAFILLRSFWRECAQTPPSLTTTSSTVRLKTITVADFVIGGAILTYAFFMEEMVWILGEAWRLVCYITSGLWWLVCYIASDLWFFLCFLASNAASDFMSYFVSTPL